MNKKANDQLKKIDQLDQQLDNTINKIGVTKIKPIKISKKKLALFILIPFSIACVISAVTSFLLIDPFHWYTKPRSQLELQQEKEIKQINQQFENLNLASSLDSANTIADLLFEINNNSNINDIVKKINEFNEIKDITSKKPDNSKLSSDGENVNIKIIVRTGSLEKEIDVKLLVIVGNYKVKRIGRLVNYSNFLNSITTAIETDGTNRVSNLTSAIKKIINENVTYKAAFNDINFDITNEKNDDEILASGIKTLNVNFSFTENNKSINSSVKLNVDLQGKNRKEINRYLADHVLSSTLSIINFGSDQFTFYAQNTFANQSTYKELIDELVLSASENNFYLQEHLFLRLDSSNSGASVKFNIDGKPDKELDKKIMISDNKWYVKVRLKLHFFVGNEEDKCEANISSDFRINVIKADYPQKDLFLGLNKAKKILLRNSLFKYEVKIKIDGVKTFGDLKAEFEIELDKILKSKTNPTIIHYFSLGSMYVQQSNTDNVISKTNLINGLYYIFAMGVNVAPGKYEGEGPAASILNVPILIREK